MRLCALLGMRAALSMLAWARPAAQQTLGVMVTAMLRIAVQQGQQRQEALQARRTTLTTTKTLTCWRS